MLTILKIKRSLLSSYRIITLNQRWASSEASKTTCLYDFHRHRQARMEMFAGYMMPIVYKSQSIKSEHMQTRNMAAAFDVSHMMQTIVRGKDRFKFIERLTVSDVQSMPQQKCTLSVFTNEFGGIIDDCIIGKCDEYLHIVSNAGNAEIVWPWLNSNLTGDVKLERLLGRGLIALQGPFAAKVLQQKLKDQSIDLKKIEFMNTFDAEITGNIGQCHITRCGYTGEDGFEISVDPRKAEQLMESLCSEFGHEVGPAGLGARDTLRLEAGLCLHGHDITDKITPVEAALNWTIHKRRRKEAGFLGSGVVLGQLSGKTSVKVKRIGLVAVKPAGPPAREHSKILSMDGKEELGEVTSGTFAPKLEKNIAMGYMPVEYVDKFDQSVMCQIRGKNYEYKLTKMPFVKSNYYFIQK